MRYVTNGRRILGDLKRYGFGSSVVKINNQNKEQGIAAARSAGASGKKLVVVIGESSDGKTVRIPGSTEGITSDDVASSNGGVPLLGLVCNSQNLLSDAFGVGVIGTVFTDQIRSMMRVVFDKRPPDSLSEFLEIPYRRVPSPQRSRVSDALGSIAQHMTVVSTSGVRTRPVLFARVSPAVPTPTPSSSTSSSSSATPPQSQESGNKPADSNPLGLLFGSGMIGGIAREFFRWKRLSNNRRADLFRHLQYFCISTVQVLLAGLVAMIFGPVVASPWQFPVGFVAGVGLEELVRRGASLQIWTPSVPHGGGRALGPSYLEYLRA